MLPITVEAKLAEIRAKCFENLLELYFGVKAGHIGSSLSCLEVLVTLLGHKMSSYDEIILSKGHAAAGLYVTLSETGRMNPELLATYYKDGTLLAAHPPCSGEISAIPFGTGSLGHGLSLAAGLAFAGKYTKKQKHVYAVLSDGECGEGSTWEAALFASHHKLTNLTVVIDANGLQGLGKCTEILNLEPFADKWRSMGFEVREVIDGNSIPELIDALDKSPTNGPLCIIARTKKGHGVEFMNDRYEWHYLPMSEEQYRSIPNRKGAGK